MREILFRGKSVTDGRWVFGDLSNYGDYKTITTVKDFSIIESCEDFSIIESCEVIPETVGQYTGLKDLHGTRIFEGDVVKSIAAWYVVEFENGGYGLRPFGKGKLIPIMGHGNFNENEVEVIGNVYDNQALLEEDKT